jgi:NADP-dependent 3-hydroxy acid dehydrogenase YdfG
MMGAMEDAVVVVTGATGAAGPATVAALVAAGATVVAVGRDQARLDALASSAGGAGDAPAGQGRVDTSVVDLLDEQATVAWGRDLLETYGRVDGLIHLVGGWRGGQGIVEADLGDYTWLHDHLVRTFQHASRALHDPIAVSPCGRIAIVSTTLLERPTAKNAAYLTAKAGAETWARALAHSVRDTGAAVVVLRIKALLTPQMRADKPDAKFSGFTPVEQIGSAVVELFIDPAEELNGEILDVVPG